ncbi:GlxA family transcriptional regulator [Curvivirga aplysinae]|uniref:GlxA family transcriptional regulator n=1 Tax=Curvivirga aplysinae TaxID=2529852 RepID=UPI0012BBED27|nr:helix-turn-helix domain-containing protein [Curvivirga aplysinae]MTI08419.1 helix-turn-helix domain-containing protein [Curvivirga aplysinae]
MPHFDIFLADNFPILSLSLITEPLRIANRESLKQVYTWRLLSLDGGPLISSSGYQLQTQKIDDEKCDVLLLLSSYNPERALSEKLINWLRRQSRKDILMGCVDTGALIFAKAGLLANQPAAVHFEAIAGYIEQYPKAKFIDKLYSFTPSMCSSAGGVSTCDMTLAIIKHYSGSHISKRAAEILTYHPSDHMGSHKTFTPNQTLPMISKVTAKAVNLMLANLEEPLSLSDICNACEIPHWKMARLFKRYLHNSPQSYYLSLRLEHGQNLLRNSSHKIYTIAAMCGFENGESFIRAYKKKYGKTPSKDRYIF